jgi:hypothetical protein
MTIGSALPTPEELEQQVRSTFNEINRWMDTWLEGVEKLLRRVAPLVGADFDDPQRRVRAILLTAAGDLGQAKALDQEMVARRPQSPPLSEAYDLANRAICDLMGVKENLREGQTNDAARNAFLLGAKMAKLSSDLDRHGFVIFRWQWLVRITGTKQRALLELFAEPDSVPLVEVYRAVYKAVPYPHSGEIWLAMSSAP